jgi:hypothetical protein
VSGAAARRITLTDATDFVAVGGQGVRGTVDGKAVAVGIEASDACLLRRAGKSAALPDLAVRQHRHARLHDRVAVAEAGGIAFRSHLESLAPFEIAVGGPARRHRRFHDVAAKRVLPVVVEILAGDIFRRRLEAGSVALGIRSAGEDQQG